jgi:hypothetical protein
VSYLALEHSHLMAQEKELGILGAVGADEQGDPTEQVEYCEVCES